MAHMADSRAAPAPVARALLSLECDCGEPATKIHIVDPATAHRTPKAPERAVTWAAYPVGETSVARAACDRHTHDGYAFEVVWALREWHGWLDHLASKGIGADEALQRLVGRSS